jgi:CubicO group peptidase (beta-lactamase class C family)
MDPEIHGYCDDRFKPVLKENGIVSTSLLDRATTILSDGEDLNVGRATRFGLGFQLSQPDRPLGPNPGTISHYGNGGHLAFADPSIALGFAYHMNHQGFAYCVIPETLR